MESSGLRFDIRFGRHYFIPFSEFGPSSFYPTSFTGFLGGKVVEELWSRSQIPEIIADHRSLQVPEFHDMKARCREKSTTRGSS
jgi:hypothetical protein